MKAAVYSKYGAPNVVSIADVPKPSIKPKEVLVKVYTSTVNRTDCGFRSAEYFIVRFFSGLIVPKNKTLGNEFSGIVEAVGAEVKNFQVGDKVFGYNDTTFGAHAEYMCISEDAPIVHMPEGMSYNIAAAMTEGSHYALCDIRAAKISTGQNILINGATGAIGSAAVQIVKALGARVTAVCHSKHYDLVKSLGADTILCYDKEDFTLIKDLFDVVFDAVGKSSFGKCKALLKPKGIYMSTELGKGSENVFLALAGLFSSGKKVLFPIPIAKKSDMIYLKELYMNKQFSPVIDREYELDQIVEAYTYVETGFKTGNVLIKINRD